MNEEQWRNEYASLDSQPTITPVSTTPVTPPKPKKGLLYIWGWIFIGLLVLGSAVLVILWLHQSVTKNSTATKNAGVKIQDVDTSSLGAEATPINLNSTDKVVVNGELQSNNGVIVTPTNQPSAGVLGQIYVDKTTNEIRYYNGQTFVTLAKDNPNLCNKSDVACGFASQSSVTALSSDVTNQTRVVSLQNQSGAVSLLGSGGLTVSAGGGNVTLALPQNLTTTGNPTFASLTLSNALSVANGGTGQVSLNANEILIGNGTGGIQSLTPPGAGLCLVSTAGAPMFTSCSGGGAAVASVNNQTGAISINNATGSGGINGTITIDDASAVAKGIASFNSTNFAVVSGAVNLSNAVNLPGTLTVTGATTFSSLGSTDTANYLCRNSTNQLAACNTTGNGAAFVQGGNSFGATATLGTNDANNLNIRTNGSTRLTIDSNGNFSQSGSGTFATGTGAVSLNGATTIANNKKLTANGDVLFNDATPSATAFVIQGGGADLLQLSTIGVTNLVSDGSFDTNPGSIWVAASTGTTPLPTLTWDATVSRSFNGANDGSLGIVNPSGGSTPNGFVAGPTYPVALSGGALGQHYTLVGYAKSDSTTKQTLKVGLYNPTLATKTECATSVTINNAFWTKIQCNFFLGAGATSSGIYFRTTTKGGSWHLDDVIFEANNGSYLPISNGQLQLTDTPFVTSGNVDGILQASNDTGVIFDVDGSTGHTTINATTDGTGVLAVNNSSGSVILRLDSGAVASLTGAWNIGNSTSLAKSMKYQAAVAQDSKLNQYAYIAGGVSAASGVVNSATATSSVSYSPLNSTSGNAAWKTAPSLPTAVTDGGTVITKGYIYMIAGATSTGGAATNTVYYNQIDSVTGGLVHANWLTASATGLVARTNFQAVAVNGYLYAIGGRTIDGSGSYLTGATSAQYIKINADGSLSGSWQSAGANLTNGLASYAVAASGSYIYLVGGTDNTTNSQSTIQYTKVNSDGTLNGWNTTTDSLPVTLSNATAAIQNDSGTQTLYVIGGGSGGFFQNTVYSTVIDNTSGDTTGALTKSFISDVSSNLYAMGRHGTVIANSTVYVIGGQVSTSPNGGLMTNRVLYAPLSSTPNSALINGKLNVTNGATLTGNVVVAPAGSDSSTVLQVTNLLGQSLVNVDSIANNITLNGLNSGEIHNWSTPNKTTLPSGLIGVGSAVANGYVYTIGGNSNTVLYAKLNADGSIGDWSTTATPLLGSYNKHNMVINANGYLYVIGGYDSGNSPTNKIYYAKPNADGTVSSWKEASSGVESSFTAVGAAAVASYNSTLYIAGGATSATGSGDIPTTPNAFLQSAHLNPDGSLGSFSSSAMPSGLMGARASVANGYLYVTGGDTGSDTSSLVYYIKLNSDGSLNGSWQNVDTAIKKAYHGSFVANGYLYIVGGYGGSGGYDTNNTDEIIYGQLNGDGTVTGWTKESSESLYQQVSDFGYIFTNGYFYIIGGTTGLTAGVPDGTSVINYGSTARVSLGGSLDLVGLGSKTLSDAGGGGELTAGNTTIVGTLDVRNAANFTQSLSVNGVLTAHNSILVQNDTNSTAALQVQNTSGQQVFGVDTTNGQALLGQASALDGKLVLYQAGSAFRGTIKLATAAQGADQTFTFPTSGGEICVKDALNCTGAGAGSRLQDAYDAGNTITTSNNKDIAFTLADTAIDSKFTVNTLGTGNTVEFQDSGTAYATFADGGVITFQNTVNSSNAFAVNNLLGNGVLTVDTTAGQVALGKSSSVNGALKFNNSSNTNTLVLQSGATTGTVVLTLPLDDGNNGDCLLSNGSGVLSFSACTGGAGGGVTSITGGSGGSALTGAIILDNSTTAASHITIDNASTSVKGIASFNSTNFTVTSGAVTTIQNIATTSNVTFNNITSNGTLTAAGAGGLSVTNTATVGTGFTLSAGNFLQSGTGTFTTGSGSNSLQGDTTVAAGKSLTVTSGATTLTSSVGGDALTVSNSTGTGNILVLKDGTTPSTVLTVANEGAVTLQNSTNSASALQVKNASGFENLLTVSTTGDTANLINNSSFENNATNWAYKGTPGSITQTTSQHHFGAGALQVTTTANANNGAKYNITLSASTTYSASFSALLSSGSFTNISFAYARDGATESNCSLVDENNVADSTVLTTYWKRFYCTFTTSASAPTGTPYIVIKQLTGTARTFYIDAVKLEQSSLPTPYYSGQLEVNANVGINSVAQSNVALFIQSAGDAYNGSSTTQSYGLVVKGANNTYIFGGCVLAVQDRTGSNKLCYQENTNETIISGGNGLGNAALSVSSENAVAPVLYLNGYLSQSADLLQAVVTTNVITGATTPAFHVKANTGLTITTIGTPDSSTSSTNSLGASFVSGNTSATNSSSGAVVLQSGSTSAAGGSSGGVSVTSGGVSGLTVGGSVYTGNLTLGTGAVSGSDGTSFHAFVSGGVTISSGTASNANLGGAGTGDVSISTGNVTTLGNGGSGSVNINVGTVAVAGGSTTYGSINIGSTNPTSGITIGNSTQTGAITLQTGTSTAALLIQNANGMRLFNVDGSTTANLITGNTGFENGVSNWSAKGSATLSQSTTNQQAGNSSLSIATTAAANDGAKTSITTLASSTTYTLSLWAKVSSGSMSTLQIGRADDGSTDTNCLTGQTLTTSWTRFTCTFTTGTVSGAPNIYIKQSDATSRTIYIDSVQLEAGSTATAFSPGGQLQLLGTVDSPLNIKPRQDSSSVLLIQNASGNNLFNVDTLNGTTTLQAGSGQSADIFQAKDSSGTLLDKIDVSGNLTVKAATFNGDITVNGHIITANASGSTTVAVGTITGCIDGSNGSVSISGNDNAGTVTINTGGTCGSGGKLATISFSGSYGSAPRVILTPAETNGATLQYYNNTTGTTSFTIDSNTTPAISTTYKYNYIVVQ